MVVPKTLAIFVLHLVTINQKGKQKLENSSTSTSAYLIQDKEQFLNYYESTSSYEQKSMLFGVYKCKACLL